MKRSTRNARIYRVLDYLNSSHLIHMKGFGGIVCPQILQQLINNYGWRVAFRYQSLMYGLVLAFAFIVQRPARPALRTSHDAEKEIVVEIVEPGAKPNPNWHYHLTFKELLHNKMLIIFLIVAGLSCFGVCFALYR